MLTLDDLVVSLDFDFFYLQILQNKVPSFRCESKDGKRCRIPGNFELWEEMRRRFVFHNKKVNTIQRIERIFVKY